MPSKSHGRAGTSVYSIWNMMKARCLNPKNKAFPLYGGRGVKVCERWMTFENFFADMGDKPEGMTLDRSNTEGDYEPSNCRWATPTEQNRNRRNARLITVDGVSKTAGAWAEITGLSEATIKLRVSRYGWTPRQSVGFDSPPSRSRFRCDGERRTEHLQKRIDKFMTAGRPA